MYGEFALLPHSLLIIRYKQQKLLLGKKPASLTTFQKPTTNFTC